MANILPTNISSLASSSLISGAKNQLSSQTKDKVKQTVLTKKDELQTKLQDLKNRPNSVNKEYDKLISNVQNDSSLSNEEKNQKINNLQQKRSEELKLINEDITKTEQDISNENSDPLKSAKKKKKKSDNIIDKNILSSKKGAVRANLARNAQITKTLGPILLSRITNLLVNVAVQNTRLQELVDKTNELIDSADTPEKIQQAIIARNNALKIIDDQEKKLNILRILITILRIVIVICVIAIIVLTIIYSIPPPGGLGPVMPSPIKRIVKRLKKIVETLALALPIISSILVQSLAELEDFRQQLRDVNDLLENKLESNTDINNNNVGDVRGNIQPGILPETYKGFKFAIREESGPNSKVVRGYKRHYAVAIDTNNVEVLKSELSFTLDPNDLIDQLKLIIDRENLIA
jgi:hypothetical protein